MSKINSKKDLVLDFIKQFRDLGAENCFSNGMCYWFAATLRMRFNGEHCHLMYTEIENHFGCEIDGVVYDITGDVTNSYNWKPWFVIEQYDRALYKRLLRDCCDKVPSDVVIGGYCGEGYYDDWGNLICSRDNHSCGWNEPCIFKEEI